MTNLQDSANNAQDSTRSAQDELKRQKRLVGFISVIWLGALAALFGWQAIHYRGILELFAEWQYHFLGHYYPGITFLLLCLFFSLPLLVMLVILWRRWKRKAEEIQDPQTTILGFSRRLQRFCTVVAAISGAVAIVSLILMLFLPSDRGKVQQIVVGPNPPPVVAEGRTNIRGAVDLAVVVKFDQQALLVHRRLHFAPVRSSRKDAAPARFFVEVREMAHLKTPFVPIMNGVLKEDSLPGDVRQLYRNVRYPIAQTTYLLYRDADRLRWRHYMIAAQLAVVAVVFTLAAWFERRRRRKLEEKLVKAVAVAA